ncbi:MAG: nitrate- and nitrite sensing domain-containing protein [Actinoplanes sp.]
MTEPTGRTRTRLWTQVGAGLLVVLWAAAAIPLSIDAAQVARTHTVKRVLGAATDAVILQVQEERRLSAGVLAKAVDRDALTAQRTRTDDACRRLRDALAAPMRRTAVGPSAARHADALLGRLDERTRLRATVDGTNPASGPVMNGYTAIIAAAFDGAPWLWPDRSTGTGSALLALGRAREALSQQDAVLLGGSGATGLDGQTRAQVVRLVLTRRVLLAEAADQLPEASRSGYRAFVADPATGRLQTIEDELITASPSARDETAAARSAALDAYRTELRAFEVSAVREAGRAAMPRAVATVAGAGLLAGVGLVAVLAVLAALRRIVRGATASAGATPAAAMGAGPGLADTDARMLELVLEQNRRNQTMVHRLLRLLDGLQRRIDDDGMLSELFRIDQLAARVRRNVEKTISLTGGTPGRRWTKPVPLVEVVRAAAAEVPDFERVSTAQVEPGALAGPVVTDVMHLLAELIENAVTFSPAETRVRVSGRRDAEGYLLTVSDHGPGMTEDDLQNATEVLAATTPPATHAWDGLYAAGRLAARAGIAVGLRNGDDGGLIAELSLPGTLLTDASSTTAEFPSLSPLPGPDETARSGETVRSGGRIRPGERPRPGRPARPGERDRTARAQTGTAVTALSPDEC